MESPKAAILKGGTGTQARAADVHEVKYVSPCAYGQSMEVLMTGRTDEALNTINKSLQ